MVLTGSWETARRFLEWRPGLALHAETSGKNAMVITAPADRDVAIEDLVKSAFGHAGQKCSAASLAILEAEVYDDHPPSGTAPRRRRRPPASGRPPGHRPGHGHPADPSAGRPAWPDAFTRLEPGRDGGCSSPEPPDAHRYLWSPGVKIGVRPGIAVPPDRVLRAGPRGHAGRRPGRGHPLAEPAGVRARPPASHALDPGRDRATGRQRVEAGNLYVNRGITGAIVRRQPFGGWKRSVVGPGAKAGGPNYVASLGSWPGTCTEASRTRLRGRTASGRGNNEGADRSDRPAPPSPTSSGTGRCVRSSCGWATEQDADQVRGGPGGRRRGRAVRRSVTERHRRLEEGPLPRAPVDGGRRCSLADLDAGQWVDATPVVADPGRELLRWVREQAVSETLHRHGNLARPAQRLMPAPQDAGGAADAASDLLSLVRAWSRRPPTRGRP